MPEPSWTLILDDSFANANTSFAGTANGITAFPETPAVGSPNDWHDKRGTDYQILNNLCAGSSGASSWNGALWRSREQFLDQRAVITVPGTSMTNGSGAWLRNGGATGGGYFIAIGASGYWGYWSAYGAFVNNFGSWSSAFTVNTAHTYTLDVRVWGGSPTNWAITITDATTSTVVYNNAGTTSLGPQTAAGFAIDPGSNGRIARVQLYTDVFSAPQITPTTTGTTSTSIKLNIVAALGGVAPVTSKLYRSTTTPFTPGPGTLVADITGLSTYTDTPGGNPGDVVHYIAVATDAGAAVVQGLSVAAATNFAPIPLGMVGDSITNGMSTSMASQFSALFPQYALTVSQQDNSGSSSTDWASNGGANSRVTNAINAFNAAGVKWISIMLGTNDARSPFLTSTNAYKANVLTVINAFKAAIPTAKFVLHGPPAIYNPNLLVGNLWDDSANARLLSYVAQLDSLCDGVTIFKGDRLSFASFAMNAPGYYNSNDPVHPSSTGAAALCQNQSKALAAVFGITAGPSGSGGGGGATLPPRIGPHLIGGISG
ncbi:MAG: GDSL-type esterase/lipase family protein [Isosphaeraceae bacterium]